MRQRDKDRAVWSSVPHVASISAGDVGRLLANSNDDDQAEMFASMATAISEWEVGQAWPIQCRSIVDLLTEQECLDIAARLETLAEHMRDQATSLYAKRIADEVVAAVNELVT